jgi:myo-inositol-1(or 4)-monophosphatase
VSTPDAVELERLRRLAEALAREAGELLRGFLGQLDESELGRKSSRRDLVTRADLASERLLVERLRAACPQHAIEAEEEARDAADPERPRWFLDPLDGTVNFVHGLPVFAVSMGLWGGGVPWVGVVHLPALGETFSAARGQGATLNGRPIAVRHCEGLGEAVLATGFPYRLGELANDNLENFARVSRRVRGVRRFGSAAVDLAYVAAGRFDGFWELHLEPHDVAAGGLLVEEAGGAVQDFAGGADWLRDGSILAGHPDLLAELRPHLER